MTTDESTIFVGPGKKRVHFGSHRSASGDMLRSCLLVVCSSGSIMQKRVGTLVVLLLLIIVGVAVFVPRFHFAISGWWHGEAFYAGRPTSYWSEAAQGGFYAGERDVFRSLREGGTLAVPVLCELSNHQDLALRSQATLALSLIDWDPRLVPESKLRILYRDPKIDAAAAHLSQEHRRILEDLLFDAAQNSPQPEDRSAAALALERLGAAGGADALVIALRTGSRDVDVRVELATRLWRHHHNLDEVLPTIDEKLHSPPGTDDAQHSLGPAISFLGEVGRRSKEAALGRLQELLLHPVSQVRRSACFALTQLIPDTAVKDVLVFQLTDPDREVRRIAAQCLASHWPGEKRSIPVLLESLHDKRVATQTPALLKRVAVADPQTIHALLQALQSSDDAGLRAASADALADIAPESKAVVHSLMTALQHDNTASVRRAAAFALMRLKAHDAIPVLIQTATDRNPDRARAGSLGTTNSLREIAIRGLGAMTSDPAAVLALIELLKNDPNLFVRRLAAEMLGHAKVEARAASVALAGALDDPLTRAPAAIALSQIDPANPRPVDVLLDILQTGDEQSRREAISSIGELGSRASAAVPALIRIITTVDGDPSVSMAITAVGKIGPAAEKAIPALTHKLGKDDGTSMISMDALAQLGPIAKSAVPRLKACLDSPSAFHRIRAAAALSKIDGRAQPHLRVIIDCLKDKNATVRGTAVSALGDLGPAAAIAVPALKAVLDDERLGMERQVRQALRKINAEPLGSPNE
jgi:HEAT repeat protein